MRKIIKSDLFRYEKSTSILKGFRFEGFRYMYFLRKASCHNKWTPLGIAYRLIVRRLGYKFGFQIANNATIGEGFYIAHFGTVVIHSNVKIGKNCSIFHSTTIGQIIKGERKGCPTIGEKVWIGTGSVIVGKINIGSNVLIAPNAFVNIDVPDNSIVIGNPAQIIAKKNPTEGYITFPVE